MVGGNTRFISSVEHDIKYRLLLYGFEESCILNGRRAVCKNPYSDRAFSQCFPQCRTFY